MPTAEERALGRRLEGAPGVGRLAAEGAIDLTRRRLSDIGRAPAAPLARTALLPPPADGRVRVVRRDGVAGEIDAAGLEATDRTGRRIYEIDTPELAARRARRREYGDRALETGATSALGGATLGLSDVAIGAAGGGDYLSGLREANPDAHMVGDVAGMIAPVLLAGPLGGVAAAEGAAGRGLLRGIVGAVGAPTRALAGLAEGAGGLVARGVTGAGASAGRRLAGRAIGVGVEGAIEGGVGEAARIMSEDAIGDGDPAMTAEMVLARIGSGALMGGAAGSVLGSAGGLLAEGGRAGARLAREGADVVSRAWSSRVGTELSPAVADMYARGAAVLGGRNADDIRRFVAPTPEGRALRELIDSGDRVYDDGGREIRRAVSDLEVAREAIVRHWDTGGLRTSHLEGMIDGTRVADQAAFARASVARAHDMLEGIVTDAPLYASGVGAAARRGRDLVAARMDDLEAIVARSDLSDARRSAEIFSAVDRIKRDLGGLQRRLGRSGGEATDMVRREYDALRTPLEDAAMWGDDVAGMQRTVNAAYSRELTTRGRYADRFLETGGTLDGRSSLDPFDMVGQGDSARIAAFLRQAGTSANETAEATFSETIDSTRRLLATMGETMELPPMERAALTRAMRAAESAADTFGEVRERARALNQWNMLSSGGSDAIGRQIIGGSVGAALGGPLGALLGGVATNPAGVIRTMATLERWTSGASDEIASGVRDFVTGAATTAARAVRTAAARTRTATVLGGVRAYTERVRRLDEDRADIPTTVARVSDRVTGMESAPRTRDAMTATTTRGMTYLASVRPRARALPGQIVPTVSREPSPEERERFMRAARVVDEPLSVVRDLANGSLTREGVAALRAVYPGLYRRLVSEVVGQIAEHGEEIPYERRLALGVLLGVPTDPALTPQHMTALQTVLTSGGSSAAASSSPPSRPPRLTTATPTGTEALERDTA